MDEGLSSSGASMRVQSERVFRGLDPQKKDKEMNNWSTRITLTLPLGLGGSSSPSGVGAQEPKVKWPAQTSDEQDSCVEQRQSLVRAIVGHALPKLEKLIIKVLISPL